MKKTKLNVTKVIKLFEYKKANKKYWDRHKLHKQVVNKVLSLVKALYPSYSLLFLFDNNISYFVYAQDVLYIVQINKNSGDKQSWLQSKWYKKNGL